MQSLTPPDVILLCNRTVTQCYTKCAIHMFFFNLFGLFTTLYTRCILERYVVYGHAYVAGVHVYYLCYVIHIHIVLHSML